jgi:hypothetical protein
MRSAFLLLAFLFLLLPSSADAAFKYKTPASALRQTAVQTQDVAFNAGRRYHFSTSSLGPRIRGFRSAYNAASDGPGFGIGSLAAGLLSLGCIALGLAGPWGFFVAAGVLAIGAVVLGTIGLKRRMRGFAIAGLIIGAAALVGGTIFAIYIAVAILSFVG